MHWALRRLGLDAGADERAVKRAYAARLKTTRPDTDPEGFQALHEAYQAALVWVRADRSGDADRAPQTTESGREAADLGPDPALQTRSRDLRQEPQRAEAVPERALGGGTQTAQGFDSPHDHAHPPKSHPSKPQTSKPHPPKPQAGVARAPAAETFTAQDLARLLDGCIERALRDGPDALRQWLQTQPALWSLQRKAQIAQALLSRLAVERPAIAQPRFDALAAFFGFDDLHAGYDSYAIHRLRHRLHLAWEVRSPQVRALAERTGEEGSSLAAAMREVERILAQLTRPLRWPQALWAALLPGFPSVLRRFLQRLDYGDLHDLPPPIRHEQVAFWDAAGNRERLSRPRFAVVAARVGAYSLALTLLHAIVGMFASPGGSAAVRGMLSLSSPLFAGLCLGLLGTLWLLYLGWETFGRWQSAREDLDERRPWLRRLALPAVPAAAMLLLELGPPGSEAAGVAVGLLLVLGAFTAWRRHRERSGPPLGRHFGFWRTSLLYVVLYTVGTESGWIDDRDALRLVALATLFIWAKDLWRQRHTLRR
jgi:hypothetical protein